MCQWIDYPPNAFLICLAGRALRQKQVMHLGKDCLAACPTAATIAKTKLSVVELSTKKESRWCLSPLVPATWTLS